MDYIVFDLEWNQGSTKRDRLLHELPFEIVEIGAVKLNGAFEPCGTFHRLIRPKVYRHMHRITGNIIHLTMKDLEQGDPFETVAADFLAFCGDDFSFCTWGTLDLTELQRNFEYFHLPKLSDEPIPFYDVQKLFSLSRGESARRQYSLEHAVEMLEITQDVPFHRAIHDAEYTARIFATFNGEILKNISFNNFNAPKKRRQEVHIVFDDYAKYISREFPTKEVMFQDREVSSMKCYLCHKNIRRKIKWFSRDGKQYLGGAKCDKHGYLRYKLRVNRSENGNVFCVKTSKIISPQDMDVLRQRQEKVRAKRETRQ